MSLLSSTSNYGGIVPSTSASVKQFYVAPLLPKNAGSWINSNIGGVSYITPSNQNSSIYTYQNLYVGGTITNPSDIKLKENVVLLSDEYCDNILKINPIKYNFIKDATKMTRIGLSAQELEQYFPELITNNVDIHNESETFKTIKYLELIPILILKLKNMQNKIDELELKMNGSPI